MKKLLSVMAAMILVAGSAFAQQSLMGGHIWRNWRVYLTEFAQRAFK